MIGSRLKNDFAMSAKRYFLPIQGDKKKGVQHEQDSEMGEFDNALRGAVSFGVGCVLCPCRRRRRVDVDHVCANVHYGDYRCSRCSVYHRLWAVPWPPCGADGLPQCGRVVHRQKVASFLRLRLRAGPFLVGGLNMTADQITELMEIARLCLFCVGFTSAVIFCSSFRR